MSGVRGSRGPRRIGPGFTSVYIINNGRLIFRSHLEGRATLLAGHKIPSPWVFRYFWIWCNTLSEISIDLAHGYPQKQYFMPYLLGLIHDQALHRRHSCDRISLSSLQEDLAHSIHKHGAEVPNVRSHKADIVSRTPISLIAAALYKLPTPKYRYRQSNPS